MIANLQGIDGYALIQISAGDKPLDITHLFKTADINKICITYGVYAVSGYQVFVNIFNEGGKIYLSAKTSVTFGYYISLLWKYI